MYIKNFNVKIKIFYEMKLFFSTLRYVCNCPGLIRDFARLANRASDGSSRDTISSFFSRYISFIKCFSSLFRVSRACLIVCSSTPSSIHNFAPGIGVVLLLQSFSVKYIIYVIKLLENTTRKKMLIRLKV